jgi:hypothetical protein
LLYLLDANVLIRAHEDYYPIDRVPQFWAWLEAISTSGDVKVPFEIYNEIAISTGPLADWISTSSVKTNLVLAEQVDRGLVQTVLEKYAPDLSDSELEEIGQDPFLIAYALVDVQSRIVVTKEVSRPSKKRANRKIPDVCKDLNINSMTDFELFKTLNFHT